MSLYITSLNSGSNGNCYYVGNNEEAVLIDVGISYREVEKRMINLGLQLSIVKAIFISHEHTDHISGVEVLAKKHNLPVYITPPVLHNSRLKIAENLIRTFKTDEPVAIGKLLVTPFTKKHDAIDPYSFIVEGSGVKIGVITDIGIACKQVIHYFKQCHAAFLESNYDEQLLEQGGYPERLKKRISGGKGHLSNAEALDLFLSHRSPYLTHLFLSHLSQNNNRTELVKELFNANANGVNIIVASRHSETPVYKISNTENDVVLKKNEPVQMNLFG